MNLSLGISMSLLFVHFYYFCYALFDHWGWTTKISDKVLFHVVDTHLFDSPFRCKLICVFFLAMSLLANQGRKDSQMPLRRTLGRVGVGILLYFGSGVILARPGNIANTGLLYIGITTFAWLLLLQEGARLSRILHGPRSADDPFNRKRAGFPQEERLLKSPLALHLRGRYTLQGRKRDSWINLVNPRRGILIMGSPGSGKSWFIIEPFIHQWMERGRPLFIYDYKYDKLSRLAWQLFQCYSNRYPPGTAFYQINFIDLSRSHRCNVLEPSTLKWVGDAVGASRTILLSINKTWANQQGEFFKESSINFLAAVIWFLREYAEGMFCSLPHAIELMQVPRTQLLNILQIIPESRMLVQPFVDAYRNKSTEMLDGQVATAMIALGRLASPDMYYILTGNDLTMDINDPAKPKIFCLGGDSARMEALRPILSLYIDQVNKQCNVPNRYPCAIVCDEFATVRAAGMLTTFATARSNNIVPVIAVQDISQLQLHYSKEETDAVLNVSGNFFCGQAAGDTAKWVSERFPKVLKDRESVSTNSSDTSVSVAPYWEDTVTSATIATLSSGEFVGIAADDPDQEMVLKAFHAKIQQEDGSDMGGMELPVIRSIDDKAVRKHADQIRKEVVELVAKQMEFMSGDKALSELMVKEYV